MENFILILQYVFEMILLHSKALIWSSYLESTLELFRIEIERLWNMQF